MRSHGLVSCGCCSGDVSTIIDELGVVARQLEHDRRALDSDAQKWQERSSLLQGNVGSRADPRACGIDGGEAPRHERSRSRAPGCRAGRARPRRCVAGAHRRCTRRLSATQEARIRAQRLQLEQAPLWQVGAAPARLEVVAAEVGTAWRSLGTYFVRDGTYLAALFVGVLALTGWLFLRGPQRRRIGAARLRATVCRVAAHRLDVAVVAGTRPADPVLRGAARPSPGSRRDGGAGRFGGRPLR